MVFYFTSAVVLPHYTLYMGFDKHENEDLIKYSFPEDVWFHVDKVSSAHVYLRLKQGETLDGLTQTVINDCAQLVKANSIDGNKMNNIDVVYTMANNLKKTSSMDVGQVGFHKNKEVRSVHIEKRQNDIVNRLNKTKEEKHPDLKALLETRDRKERDNLHQKMKDQKQTEKDDENKRKEDAKLKSYSSLMTDDKMTSNYDAGNDSDEFM